MDENAPDSTLPPAEQLPTQPHTCTAVIEDLVAETPDTVWDDVEKLGGGRSA